MSKSKTGKDSTIRLTFRGKKPMTRYDVEKRRDVPVKPGDTVELPAKVAKSHLKNEPKLWEKAGTTEKAAPSKAAGKGDDS
jgi:hypothetical protein